MIDAPERLADDLEEIARAIPPMPRGLGFLRQQLALLPWPGMATTQGSFPADEMLPPEAAAAASGLATVPGAGSIGPGGISDGAVGTPQLRDSAATITKFASGIRPVQIVGALPSLPDPLYPQGAVVFLTTDNKLYRSTGSAWTAAVGSVNGGIEPVGALPSLPSASYPEGAVVFLTTDDKLYRSTGSAWTRATDGADITAGSITGDRLVAGTIDASRIAANTITAAEIAANAIGTSELNADSVTAGKIAAGAVSTDELAANAITAEKIQAGELTVDKILFGTGKNVCPNPSFEYVVSGSVLVGWEAQANYVFERATSAAPVLGTYTGRLTAQAGAAAFLGAWSKLIPVEAGKSYILAGWARKSLAGGAAIKITIVPFDKDGVQVSGAVSSGTTTSSSMTELVTPVKTIPTDNSIVFLRAKLEYNSTPATNEASHFDAIDLVALAGTTEIEDDSISTAKIQAGAITATEIATNTITAAKIQADAITASEIAAGAINADHIQADAITTGKIIADAITTSKINGAAVTSGKMEGTISGKTFLGDAGGAGAPGFAFSGDSNTGMFNSAANQIAFVTGGVARMFIDGTQIFCDRNLEATTGRDQNGWDQIFCVNLTETSDIADKMVIRDEPLGMGFLRLLRPRTWRKKRERDRGGEKAAVAALEADPAIAELRTQIAATHVDDPQANRLRKKLATLTNRHQRAIDKAMNRRIAGKQRHHGFVAQEVKQALDAAGVDPDDAAFWTTTPDGKQALRYTQLISVLVAAVQELDGRLTALEG